MDLGGWDPLRFLHRTEWYKRLLEAEWFKSIRPYWEEYRLDWAVALLLVLLFFLLVRVAWRHRRGGAGKRRLLLRMARAHERHGELAMAAEAWQKAGRLKRALRLYLKIEDFSKAAEVAESLGRVEEAVSLLKKARNFGHASALAEQNGLLELAAELCLETDDVVGRRASFKAPERARRPPNVSPAPVFGRPPPKISSRRENKSRPVKL